MELSSLALLGFAVVGSVEFVKRLFDTDYRSACIIAVAGLVGGFGGTFLDLPFFQGLVVGLQGAGLVTTASYISGK